MKISLGKKKPDMVLLASRVFSEEEIQLARSRMPTERKFMTGLFKWEDIKRWHTTWPVYLCEQLQLWSANFRY